MKLMRRLLSIAAFALLLSVPVWAQHGGHGGGGHAGFGGGHAGEFGGGHVGGGIGIGRVGGLSGGSHFNSGSRGFSGSRVGSSYSPGYPRWDSRFSHQPFLHNGFANRGFRNYGFRNNCYGYRCGWGSGSGWGGWGYGYPWWGSAYYDPWWWNQDDQEFDQDYYGQYQAANEMNQQSLEEQQMYHQEEADGDQDAYAPRRPAPRIYPPQAQQTEPAGQPIMSPTVLVFRDQHREEVQNYAIVGNTLWNFAPGHTQKVLLASLDLPATEKVNEDRGVTFRVPATKEGQ